MFLPVALALQLAGVSGPWLFVVSGVAILGAVTLIGKATEEIAIYAGALWGGLLNATFGDVSTELIVALFASTPACTRSCGAPSRAPSWATCC